MNRTVKTLIKASVSTIGYETKYFTLVAETDENSTRIMFNLMTSIVRTDMLPKTYSILKHYMPRVLETECKNKQNLPFEVEVKNTEIGHLFEHILLENLYQLKNENLVLKGKKGGKTVKSRKKHYSGITKWDWTKYPKGTFNVTVNTKLKDLPILHQALEKSVLLTAHILNSGR